MAMTVKLYKDSKVDGVTRLGKWGSKSEQIAYFDTLTSKTYSVPTVGLGQPLRINDKLNNLMSYGYGFIDYGDGFRYYFTVADLQFVTETITDLSYVIDCYDTAITQTNVSLDRASITRYPSLISKSGYPYTETTSYYLKLNSFQTGTLVALAFIAEIKAGTSDTKEVANFILPLSENESRQISSGYSIATFCSLNFDLGNITFADSDIILACFMPMCQNGVIDNWNEISPKTTVVRATALYYSRSSNVYDKAFTLSCGAGDDEGLGLVIKDMRGNDIFEFEPNVSYNITKLSYNFSSTAINLVIFLKKKYVSGYETLEDYEFTITVPSESFDIYVDAYKEYRYRQRSLDIALRTMQLQQQALSTISGLTGNISANPLELADTAGDVLTSIGNYAISKYYSGTAQDLTDKKYQNANIIVTQSGTCAQNWIENNCFGLYNKVWDKTARDRRLKDIGQNGYYVNYVTADFSSKIVKGPITADVEVLGDIPISWKEQIHSRFLNGVKIV